MRKVEKDVSGRMYDKCVTRALFIGSTNDDEFRV